MKYLYQIREISTLSFNERVLQEAEDHRNPLMERLRFLGIFSSNMDEFFKVRVASIKRMLEMGRKNMREVLRMVGDKSRELDKRFRAAYQAITTALAQQGVTMLNERDLDAHEQDLAPWVLAYFRTEVLPHLVPIIVREGVRFPQIVDGALYFGVVMRGPVPRYAILEIPATLKRFVELPNHNIMYLDDVIRYSLNDVFYIFEYDYIEAYEFKISRDAELDIDNDFSEDILEKMERGLKQRKGGRPTRLVYDASMPQELLNLLVRKLHIGDKDTLIGGGRYHNMKDLINFPNILPHLCFEPMEPVKHPVLDRRRSPMMDVIEDQDLLVTYPYQSFGHVIRLLREAAIDPQVESIKMSLYRVAKRSQVVNALVNAAHNGKEIIACVELMARFDEERNIQICERLEEVGATVLYGLPPWKTHCKLLQIRRNGLSITGLSTGNFNEATARAYVDSTLLTAHPGIGSEVDALFAYIAKCSKHQNHTGTKPSFRHLMVSPFNTRNQLIKHISRERAKGNDGYILLKVNHLTDPRCIKKLVEAAAAGVHMDLIVRTTFGMEPRPNMRAISILDRFLEHQRIYIFGKGEERRVFMSSADLMQRNLDTRVEAAFPILDEALKAQVEDMVRLQVADTCKARILDATQANHYVRDEPEGLRAQYETHAYLRKLYTRSVHGATAEAAESVLVSTETPEL